MNKYKQRYFINNPENENSSSYLLYPSLENICEEEKKNTDLQATVLKLPAKDEDEHELI